MQPQIFMLCLLLADPSSNSAFLPGQSASEVGIPCGHLDYYQAAPGLWCPAFRVYVVECCPAFLGVSWTYALRHSHSLFFLFFTMCTHQLCQHLFIHQQQVLLLPSSGCCMCGGLLVPLWEEQWPEETKERASCQYHNYHCWQSCLC